MITTIILLALAFGWLLWETDYLRVQLYIGKLTPKYARYKVYNKLSNRKPTYGDTLLYEGDNYPADYSPNGEPEYYILLSPGVKGVLCGYDWLNEHCANMVDYKPQVFMTIGNIRYNMTINKPSVIKDIMKANHLTRKQLKALHA